METEHVFLATERGQILEVNFNGMSRFRQSTLYRLLEHSNMAQAGEPTQGLARLLDL